MRKLTLTAVAAVLVALAAMGATRSRKSEISRNLDIFNALYKELQTFYVDSIDAQKSIETAIAAMLDDIDPYTEYFPAREKEQFRTLTTGEYGGIGSMIQKTPRGVIISEPYENSPAARAGLRAGDLIVMIDNDTVTAWDSNKVSDHLKGPAGSHMRLLINRPYTPPGTDSMLTVDITRAKIQIPPVPYYGMLPGGSGVGYIQLTTFNDKSYPEVRQALTELLAGKPAGIVLDLRGNGGGLVESAVQILGLFLPKGTAVLNTKGRGVLNEKTYKTSVQPLDTKIPLAVLIDGGSASASEIVTGAVQDLDRGVVIGNRSFGKGLVQSTRELPADGMLKVTVAKYYIPSGRLIQAIDYSHRNPDGSVARIPDSLTRVWHTAAGREVRDGGGITPDVKVELPDINRLTYNIVRDNWAFDYATRLAAGNPRPPCAAEDFTVTDSIWAGFKASIDPARFQYDKVCETALEELRKIAKAEGYMNDSTQAQLDVLAGMLRHNLDHDLETNRANITAYLAPEIAARYWYQRGRTLAALKDDPTLDKAVEVLTSAQYTRLLSPAPKDKDKAKQSEAK